jgi:hypothetical protein
MNASTSCLRPAGSMRSRPEVMASRTGPAYLDSRKNQFSSVTGCGLVSCSGHRPPRSSAGW